jgi:stage III sporulation protein AD
MDMLNIAGVAITVAAFAVLLRQYKQEYALLLGVSAGIMIFLLILNKAQPAFSQINGFIEKSGVNTAYAEILIKAMGICFVTQFAADACKDAGESAMASKVELAGKFAVLLIALPLFTQVANLAIGLIGS